TGCPTRSCRHNAQRRKPSMWPIPAELPAGSPGQSIIRPATTWGRIIIMDHQMLQQRFAALTTAHLADACKRAQVPVRCASALLRAVAPGRSCLSPRHAGSVDTFLEAFEAVAPGNALVTCSLCLVQRCREILLGCYRLAKASGADWCAR